MLKSSHSVLATPLGDKAVPDWVHLTPSGVFRGGDGRGPYRVADAAAVAAASMANGKLPIDENHATDLAAPKGQPSPAMGWIVEMQPRPDGIWGRVEWTKTGHRLMSEAGYRGISPVFLHETDGGTIKKILRAALTNNPNLPQLTALNGQRAPASHADQGGSYQPGLSAVDREIYGKMGIPIQKVEQFRRDLLARADDPSLSEIDRERVRRFRKDMAVASDDPALTAYDTRKVASFVDKIGSHSSIKPFYPMGPNGDNGENEDSDTSNLTALDRELCRRFMVSEKRMAWWKRNGKKGPLAPSPLPTGGSPRTE